MKKLLALLLAALLVFSLCACDLQMALEGYPELTEDIWQTEQTAPAQTEATEPSQTEQTQPIETEPSEPGLDEDGWYYSADEVALYLHTFGKLPSNFITKDKARDLGWEGGSVEKFLEGAAIGGDKFGNREGILPKASGRQYYECDIDTNGRNSRGAKRIVFSNDGLIYYTDDHYETFTLLYGEE